ncbi:MAG: chemotaxis protein CheX [Planctomycetota bacterium]
MATTMKVELINPFVSATVHVFKTMFSTELKRGQVYLRKPDQSHGGVSGVIGLSGQALGTAAIIVSDSTAIKITERFLGMDIADVNEDVVDCIGEVINMVAGNAKAQMEQYHLSISLPSIVRGKDHLIEFPSNVTPICIPFTSDIGDLMVQIGFIMND